MFFIDGEFDESTGLSHAMVLHNGEYYSGEAKLNPEDEDKKSKFYGCRIAEKRAELKALKAELKEKRLDYNKTNNFMKAVMSHSSFNSEDPSAKAMFRQLNLKKRDLNNLILKIAEMEDDIATSIAQHDIVTKAIQRKLNSKND